MAGAITVAAVITMDGVEAITMDGVIIIVGETSLPSDDYSRRSRLVWRLLVCDNSHLRCPFVARNGHGAMSDLSPLSGVKRTSSARSEYFRF